MVTTAQIRGAGAIPGLQQAELADAASTALADLDRIEHGAEGDGTAVNAGRLAFDASGIIFEANRELIAGGRLTRPRRKLFNVPNSSRTMHLPVPVVEVEV